MSFTYLYDTLFPIIGNFLGWFSTFANMTFSEFLNFMNDGGVTITSVNLFTGVTTSITSSYTVLNVIFNALSVIYAPMSAFVDWLFGALGFGFSLYTCPLWLIYIFESIYTGLLFGMARTVAKFIKK